MAKASQTKRHLRGLCNDIAARTTSGTLPEGVEADHDYFTDCLDRFNIWAGSLGVFQSGDASLDARLSNHILARLSNHILARLSNHILARLSNHILAREVVRLLK